MQAQTSLTASSLLPHLVEYHINLETWIVMRRYLIWFGPGKNGGGGSSFFWTQKDLRVEDHLDFHRPAGRCEDTQDSN